MHIAPEAVDDIIKGVKALPDEFPEVTVFKESMEKTIYK